MSVSVLYVEKHLWFQNRSKYKAFLLNCQTFRIKSIIFSFLVNLWEFLCNFGNFKR